MILTAKAPEIPNFVNMRGSSMRPTIHAGEGAFYDPEIDKRALVPGDVIIYTAPNDENKKIVHRIVEKRQDGYITRGDNNRGIDHYTVDFKFVIGKVTALKRGSEKVMLLHGKQGLALSKKLQFIKFCRIYLLIFPSLISKIIETSKIFNFLHSTIKVDIVRIKRGEHFQEIMLRNNKLIGKRCISSGKWQIKFPYKYFICKDKL